MTESNVSVIVVSFNTKEKLRRCLGCIEPEHEVIVIDNASTDGSCEMVASEFPAVLLIRNSENRGFGAANNLGLDAMSRELALFLNSDCYAEPDAIAKLASSMSDPAWVAVGGKLLNPDGSLQQSVANHLSLFAVFMEQSFLEKVCPIYWITLYLDHSLPILQVPQVMGACLMIRPLERFDERFFLYCEDTELCFRLSGHGKIGYVHASAFTHDLGSSSVGLARWKSVARYNRGKELYFLLHHGSLSSWICWYLDRSGALLRLLIWLVPTVLTLGTMARFRNRVALFARVLTSPLRGPDPVPHTPR